MTLRVVALRGGVAHDPRSSSSTSTSSLARRSIRSWPAFRPFSDHRAPKDPHRSAGVISAVDRSRKVGKALEVSPRTVFRTMAEPKSEREREREREKEAEKERERTCPARYSARLDAALPDLFVDDDRGDASLFGLPLQAIFVPLRPALFLHLRNPSKSTKRAERRGFCS